MLLFISDMQQRRIEMEKIEAQKKLKQYLNKNLIPFSQNNELDYMMQYRGYENCPDKTLESVIFSLYRLWR